MSPRRILVTGGVRSGKSAYAERSLTGHVLGRFAPEERELLEAGLDRALQAVNYAQIHGLQAAMNQFN